jgi:hypothetical protein
MAMTQMSMTGLKHNHRYLECHISVTAETVNMSNIKETQVTDGGEQVMRGDRRVAEMTHTSLSALDNGDTGKTMSAHAIYQILLYSIMYAFCIIAEFVFPLCPYKQVTTKKW